MVTKWVYKGYLLDYLSLTLEDGEEKEYEKVITLADHHAVVAEKDKEIEALEELAYYLIPNADSPITWKEYAEDQLAEKDKAYHEMMQQTVRFAEQIFDSGINKDKRVKAAIFLSRPEVVAFKKQQEGKIIEG